MGLRFLDYGFYQMYKTMGCFGINYDVQETEKQIFFKMGTPGLKKEDIEIKIRDGKRLIVKSLKSNKFTQDFYYAFVLPTEISKDETFASLEDGILTVTLEKKKPKEFNVRLQ